MESSNVIQKTAGRNILFSDEFWNNWGFVSRVENSRILSKLPLIMPGTELKTNMNNIKYISGIIALFLGLFLGTFFAKIFFFFGKILHKKAGPSTEFIVKLIPK